MGINILAATAAVLAALTLAAQAQDLPKHHFKVLIQDSPTPHVKLLEAPLWNEWIPAASKGQITADAAPYDQVGIPDDAVLRLLKLGAFDFASFDIAKVAGDDPKFEGCGRSGTPSCSRSAPRRRRRSGARPRCGISTTSRARSCACSPRPWWTSRKASAPRRSTSRSARS